MITPSQQSSASREVRAIQAHASDLRRLAESNASIDTEQYKLSAALAHALRGEMRHQRAISGIRGGGGHNAVHGAGQLSGLQLFSLGALEYYYEPLVPLIRTYKELSRNFTAVLEGDEIDTPALRASQPYFMMLYTQLTPADQMVDTSQPLNNSAIEYLDL